MHLLNKSTATIDLNEKVVWLIIFFTKFDQDICMCAIIWRYSDITGNRVTPIIGSCRIYLQWRLKSEKILLKRVDNYQDVFKCVNVVLLCVLMHFCLFFQNSLCIFPIVIDLFASECSDMCVRTSVCFSFLRRTTLTYMVPTSEHAIYANKLLICFSVYRIKFNQYSSRHFHNLFENDKTIK